MIANSIMRAGSVLEEGEALQSLLNTRKIYEETLYSNLANK